MEQIAKEQIPKEFSYSARTEYLVIIISNKNY